MSADKRIGESAAVQEARAELEAHEARARVRLQKRLAGGPASMNVAQPSARHLRIALDALTSEREQHGHTTALWQQWQRDISARLGIAGDSCLLDVLAALTASHEQHAHARSENTQARDLAAERAGVPGRGFSTGPLYTVTELCDVIDELRGELAASEAARVRGEGEVVALRTQIAELYALGVSLHKATQAGRERERADIASYLRCRNEPGWANAIARGAHVEVNDGK